MFSGHPLTYAKWKKSFTTLVEQHAVRQEDRMHYLNRYLSGKALKCVQGYMLLDSGDAYNDAKKLLEERFGNPFVLANASRSKRDKWHVIHGTNHEGLREFSDYLRQCRAAMKSIPSLSVLNDCHER